MLSEYQTVEDAQEAYGYDMITYEDYLDVVEVLERGKVYIQETKTPVNLALGILREFYARLEKDLAHFEIELLPDKEKERLQAKAEEWQEKKERRGPVLPEIFEEW